MSAMIDVVFLLLIFFVMTFQIVPQEGDFSIDASPPKAAGVQLAETLPLHVRLSAGEDGSLAGVALNGRALSSLDQLHDTLIELSHAGALHDVRMSLECDSTLKYEHVIDTMDAVTAYHDAVGVEQPLVSSVAFVSSG